MTLLILGTVIDKITPKIIITPIISINVNPFLFVINFFISASPYNTASYLIIILPCYYEKYNNCSNFILVYKKNINSKRIYVFAIYFYTEDNLFSVFTSSVDDEVAGVVDHEPHDP
jgi:hypothetical protein